MSITTELMLEDEARQIAEVRAQYEARIAELEAENATLRRDLYALSDAFTAPPQMPAGISSSKTIIHIYAERGENLQVGSYFEWVAGPEGGMVTAKVVPAGAENIDGVVVDLSIPGQVGFCPCTSVLRR